MQILFDARTTTFFDFVSYINNGSEIVLNSHFFIPPPPLKDVTRDLNFKKTQITGDVMFIVRRIVDRGV